MTTIFDYLASLTIGTPAVSVIWSDFPLTDTQIAAANGKPYVRVVNRPATQALPVYGSRNVMSRFVDLNIAQAIDSTTGVYPAKNDAMELFYKLLDAPVNVDEMPWKQPITLVELDSEVEPEFNVDTGGIFGNVRLHFLYPRGPT